MSAPVVLVGQDGTLLLLRQGEEALGLLEGFLYQGLADSMVAHCTQRREHMSGGGGLRGSMDREPSAAHRTIEEPRVQAGSANMSCGFGQRLREVNDGNLRGKGFGIPQ